MNALGLTLTIFFGLLSLVLSLILYFRGRHRKCLRLTWDLATLQVRNHPEITILFKDKQVENLSRLRVLVWNNGNQEIRRSDIPTGGKPSLKLTGATIFSVMIPEASGL